MKIKHLGLGNSNKNEKLITKPVSDPIFLRGKRTYAMFTKPLELKKLEENSSIIFPSLVQKNVEKAIELRIFYLSGTCYTAAIFSQKEKRTKNDFRNYNDDKPTRIVPYTLPDEISRSIVKFMKIIGLNTGSIDMIVTPSDKYIFLEVNPVGQFEMISFPCNYYLEEKIANFLI